MKVLKKVWEDRKENGRERRQVGYGRVGGQGGGGMCSRCACAKYRHPRVQCAACCVRAVMVQCAVCAFPAACGAHTVRKVKLIGAKK